MFPFSSEMTTKRERLYSFLKGTSNELTFVFSQKPRQLIAKGHRKTEKIKRNFPCHLLCCNSFMSKFFWTSDEEAHHVNKSKKRSHKKQNTVAAFLAKRHKVTCLDRLGWNQTSSRKDIDQKLKRAFPIY